MQDFQLDRRGRDLTIVWYWFGWRLLFHVPLAVYVNYWLYTQWDLGLVTHFVHKTVGVLFAGGVTYTALVGLVNRITVEVTSETIQVTHYPLPLYFKVKLRTDEIQSVFVKKTTVSSGSGSRNRSRRWHLAARMKSGEDKTLFPTAVPRGISIKFQDVINNELEEQRA